MCRLSSIYHPVRCRNRDSSLIPYFQFFGYTDNLGAKQNFLSTDDFWMFGAKNTDYIYRIAPSVTYFVKNLELALEGDYTVVGYGDLALDGNTKALRDVANLRACLMVRYRF